MKPAISNTTSRYIKASTNIFITKKTTLWQGNRAMPHVIHPHLVQLELDFRNDLLETDRYFFDTH